MNGNNTENDKLKIYKEYLRLCNILNNTNINNPEFKKIEDKLNDLEKKMIASIPKEDLSEKEEKENLKIN